MGDAANHGVYDGMQQRDTTGWGGHDVGPIIIQGASFYDGFYSVSSNPNRQTTWTICYTGAGVARSTTEEEG